MARNADLRDTLNMTLNSGNFFQSSREASADFLLNVLLDDAGHKEKDRYPKKINVNVTLGFPSRQYHK